MPGYGALNFHRLVSNGYLHYRMFSKVKRLKFILVFERCDINYNAERVLNSIFIFIDTFKGYK